MRHAGKGYRFTRSSQFPARPKTRLDRVGDWFVAWGGVCYCVFIVVTVTWFARFVACPEVYDDAYCTDLDVLAVFLVGQIMGNLAENRVEHWQRHSVVASLCRSMIGDEEQGGSGGSEEVEEEEEDEERERERNRGKYCVECNRYAPIRSHHCPLCHECVLRKDHHCYITGACVGLGNQRYFITFLFWATIGCAVGARYIVAYADQEIAHWYPFGWVHYIAPVTVGRWIFGYAPIWSVVTCIIFSFACASCMGAFAFFVTQLFYTLHGYTMFEYHSLSIREAYEGDGRGIGDRMRLVFGPYWALNFIFPAFWLKQKLTPEIADNLFRVRSKLL
ncbi:dhhc-10 [Pristionchus pacificus]|uniref:Palmitoyltransferase n=1 Tax=Pristionchus pacificus TaxID=54126 RepID=A0A2A6C6X9_PRIPA|nr:dhhc-10 [Pristionchus pacificus]|eukprot:PDM73962.1 dhhc-10 [Pristionchus pacificus]